MKYELLLQPAPPNVLDAGALEAVLMAGGAKKQPEGFTCSLTRGEAEIVPVREGGAVVAFAVRVPLTELDEPLIEAARLALELAAATTLTLFDPQRVAAVSKPDDAAMLAEYRRMARYAGEMAGVSEAIGASFSVPGEGGLSASAKVFIGLGVLIALGLFLLDRIGR